MSDYLGKTLLVPVLRALLDERVPVRFEVVTTHSRDAVRRVGRGEVEFGVVSADTVPTGLEDAPLGGEPLLRLGAESHGRRLLDDFLARERIRPVSTIDVPGVSLLLSYVGSGLGVGLVPAVALGDMPARRVVIERADVPATPVKLVYRPSTLRNPIAERFAAAVTAEGRRVAGRVGHRVGRRVAGRRRPRAT